MLPSLSLTVSVQYMELLLRLLLSHPTAPAVIEIQQRVRSDPPYLWSPHSDVCEYYGVPVLSYDRASLDLMGRHPNCLGHQTMADWLAYQWLQATKHSCDYHVEQIASRRELLPVARYSGKKYEATHTSSDAELVDFCQYPLTSILPRLAPPSSSLNLSHPKKRYHSTSNWMEGEDEVLNSKPGMTPEGWAVASSSRSRSTADSPSSRWGTCSHMITRWARSESQPLTMLSMMMLWRHSIA